MEIDNANYVGRESEKKGENTRTYNLAGLVASSYIFIFTTTGMLRNNFFRCLERFFT